MRIKLSVAVLFLLVIAGASRSAGSARAQAVSYGPLSVVTLPLPSAAYDISWVDPASRRYYMADRTNATVNVIDTRTDTLVGHIGSFVGNTGHSNSSGPDGVLVTPDLHQLWAGDGDSTVKVFDAASGALLASIATGGQLRSDELAYDGRDQVIVIANDADTPPFLSFISASTLNVVGTLPFPNATGGLEQPIWDPTAGLFYQAVPESTANPGGEVAVIDPTTMKVIRTYPLTDCNPTGMALGPNQQMLLACGGAKSQHTPIIDVTTGNTVADITDVGHGDETWYNPGDNHYYLSGSVMTTSATGMTSTSTVLGVIDAGSNRWITNAPTIAGAHSVAADPVNNHIYVPLNNIGIGVYGVLGQGRVTQGPPSVLVGQKPGRSVSW